METVQAIWQFVWQTLISELLVVVAGVLIANFILRRWREWRYGGWHVVITHKDQKILDRPLSANKAQALLNEPADLNVFLKGLVGVYGDVKCDLVTEGVFKGVYINDPRRREITIRIQEPHILPKPPLVGPTL